MGKIYHIVSNKAWGGGEQYVYDLAHRQMVDGHEVALFCRPVDAVLEKFSALRIPVSTLRLNGVLDWGSAWRMSRVLKHAGRCTVHAHNFKDAFTACYARRLSGNQGVRVVMSRHLTRPGKDTLPYRWLYGQLDLLHFDSQLARSVFLGTHPHIDTAKLRVVHTSIVLPEHLEPVDVRREFSIPAHHVLAMYHGRLDAEKGLDVLLEAASLLGERPFTLVLVGRGDDDYTRHLQQVIAQKGLGSRVLLAGFRHPVLPFVATADFGLLPSVVREGCPLSPMEYMSQGHAVVATDNGGQREYIVDGCNGLLVPPADHQQLAAAMARLIDDADLRHRLGRQAQADFMAQLHYDHFYRQVKAFYEG